MNARRTAVTQPRDLKLWLRATLPKGVLRPSDARQSHHFEKSRPTLLYIENIQYLLFIERNIFQLFTHPLNELVGLISLTL